MTPRSSFEPLARQPPSLAHSADQTPINSSNGDVVARRPSHLDLVPGSLEVAETEAVVNMTATLVGSGLQTGSGVGTVGSSSRNRDGGGGNGNIASATSLPLEGAAGAVDPDHSGGTNEDNSVVASITRVHTIMASSSSSYSHVGAPQHSALSLNRSDVDCDGEPNWVGGMQGHPNTRSTAVLEEAKAETEGEESGPVSVRAHGAKQAGVEDAARSREVVRKTSLSVGGDGPSGIELRQGEEEEKTHVGSTRRKKRGIEEAG